MLNMRKSIDVSVKLAAGLEMSCWKLDQEIDRQRLAEKHQRLEQHKTQVIKAKTPENK